VRLGPFEIALRRRGVTPDESKALQAVNNRGGWWPLVRESVAGAWQHGVTVTVDDATQYWAVFRCVGIVASDVAKMRMKLVEQRGIGGIWKEVEDRTISPLLETPNPHQTRIQFLRNWMESKLTRGNAYILKRRDGAGRVVGLYVLDPMRTTPMIDEAGNVFYQLHRDDLVGVGTTVTVPASEIIHDRWNTLFHPLVGLSPIYALGLNALSALRIEQNSLRLFQNGARPSGVLEAPGAISQETADRVKAYWDENFTGENAGKVAVLGDGLAYKQMVMTAVDAQLIDQLKWNDTVIAGCYGVPAYMINAGTAPAYNNVEALNQQYYSQALQTHVEDIEILLDKGLELGQVGRRRLGIEFELDDLLRMDTATLVKTAGDGVKAGILKPDEARAKLGLDPVPGGDTVYLQQQNYSIEALARRDAKEDPFASAAPATPAPAADPANDDSTPAADAASIKALIEAEVARQVGAIEIPAAPAPLTPADLRPLVGEVVTVEVQREIAALPAPPAGDGVDQTAVAEAALLEEMAA